MTKSYLKVVLMGVVTLLLCYFNKAYSLYIMLLFIFVCAINAYQLESHYQRMGRFFQREKDNEIKEVEIENKYHEKILSQLIRSMNLPMLFIFNFYFLYFIILFSLKKTSHSLIMTF